MKKITYAYPLTREGYSTRTTQSILQYGVGAMVDFKDQTLMTAAPEFWANNVSTIHDKRLEKALGVKGFGMPGTDNNNSYTKEGVSYVRFPEWYFCPVCRRFMPLNRWIEEHNNYASQKTKEDDPYMMKNLKCYKDKCNLVAAGIIVVCEEGHISDFPWVEWAHAKSTPRREVCPKPLLKYRTGTSVSEGLQGVIIECEACKASATLKDAFRPGIFEDLVLDEGRTEFRCKGRHPWKGSHTGNCQCFPITKQRGDSSVYFSNTVSSIVIPTNTFENEDRVLNSRYYLNSISAVLEDCDSAEEYRETVSNKIDKWANKIAEEIMLNSSSVKRILWNHLTKEENENTDEGISIDNNAFRYEEYCALSGIDERANVPSEDFLREEMDVKNYDIPGVDKIVLVKKLREVRALVGFSRVKPVNVEDSDSKRFVSIKEADTDWYPGYQIRGEGIFIGFNIDQLVKWSQTDFAIRRREQIRENLDNSSMVDRLNVNVDASYVLLHTVAHLLIKQLSFECGYNVASLRERVYYNYEDDGDMNMAGILIYTASGDSEGTLGGLVRQGRSDCLSRVFREAVENARLCSNDPVCITSMGQGRESLNMAACHSCCLLPETSCEQYNTLLDRALVIGTFEEPNKGFYSVWKKGIFTAKKINKNENNNQLIRVCDDGQMQTGSYEEIWSYLKEDTDDKVEKETIDLIIQKSVGIYEKPIYGGSVEYNQEIITVDFIWRNSKVLLFLADCFEEYTKLKNCGWTTYCLKENFDIDLFLDSIKEN